MSASSTRHGSTGARSATMRLCLLAAACLVALPGFAPLFIGRRYLVTGTAALVVGLLLSVLLHRRGWGPLRGALLALGATLLLGTVMLTPHEARWGWVPTRAALRALVHAPVTAWVRALTASAPLGEAGGVLIVVWTPLLLAGIVAGALALRGRASAALLGPAIVLGTPILLGPAVGVAALGRGIALGVLCLALMLLTPRHRLDVATPSAGATRRSVLGTGSVLGIAAGGALLLAPRVPEPGPRRGPRDHLLPAWDPWQEPSPLSALRGHRTRRADRPLVEAEGLRPGDRLRLAVMDRYDGQAMLSAGGGEHPRRDAPGTGSFHRCPWGAMLRPAAAAPRQVTITVRELRGPWLPLPVGRPGRIARLDPAGQDAAAEQPVVNVRSGCVALPGGLQGGERYRVEVSTAPVDLTRLREAGPAPDRLPPAPSLPPPWQVLLPALDADRGGAYAAMGALADDLTAACAAQGPRQGMPAPMPGHGLARLLTLTEGIAPNPARGPGDPREREGDEEQLTVLLALLARAVGIPARVVLGFRIPERPPSPLVLHGADVTAWVELQLEGIGWAALDLPAPLAGHDARSDRT